jgi:glycosyltransferase involved in cell wall biosynthesis
VVVFVSRANYDTARARGLVRTGTVIHNGLPAPRPRQAGLDPEGLSFLERDIARRELEGITRSELKDTFLIGSIGRLDMAKNYEFLVEQMADIAAGHPHVRALIIGDGSERQKVEHLIKKRGLGKSVILAGDIPHAARYLKAFDVFVLPSRYEGFSISILEALFAGIPILASDVGGAKEQLSHAPFQAYPPGNAKAFCERMERLIENPPVRKELAEANRARSGDFHIDKTADAYMRLYNGDIGATRI